MELPWRGERHEMTVKVLETEGSSRFYLMQVPNEEDLLTVINSYLPSWE